MPDYGKSLLLWSLGEGKKGLPFTGFQSTPFSWSKIVEIEVADPDSNETLHTVAHGLDHVTYLSLEAGFEGHFHATGGEAFDRGGTSFADLGVDAFFKLGENGILEGVLHGDVIDFFDAMLWVGQGLGELAVIAEDEESFGFQIESTNVHEVMHFGREEFVNRGASVFVAPAADQPGGFVKDDGLDQERLNALSRSPNGISGLHAVSGVKADVAIDDHFTLLNQCIAAATGTDSSGSEVFVQSDSFRCHDKRKSGARNEAPL